MQSKSYSAYAVKTEKTDFLEYFMKLLILYQSTKKKTKNGQWMEKC